MLFTSLSAPMAIITCSASSISAMHEKEAKRQKNTDKKLNRHSCFKFLCKNKTKQKIHMTASKLQNGKDKQL